MDYEHISGFLDKFKKIVFKNEEYYDIISSVLTKHLSTPIDKKLIKIKNNIIYIQTSPIIKNEVFIHKNGILEDIKSLLPSKDFQDIK